MLSYRKSSHSSISTDRGRRDRNLIHPRDLARREAVSLIRSANILLLVLRHSQDPFLAVELRRMTDTDPGSGEGFAGLDEIVR